jgi:hypothetical protein
MLNFACAMTYVAIAILDFERHRLTGLATWYTVRISDYRPSWRRAGDTRLHEAANRHSS